MPDVEPCQNQTGRLTAHRSGLWDKNFGFRRGQDVVMAYELQSVLHVLRGKSRYPLRAVDEPQYLIGAGSSCHLQLSAGEMPMIFAVLRPDTAGCTVEAFHPDPQLTVNGTICREARLSSGDVLQIGPYEFEYLERQIPIVGTDEVGTDEKVPIDAPSLVPALPTREQIAELSAEELVDRIAEELARLDELGDYDDLPIDAVIAAPDALPRKSA